MDDSFPNYVLVFWYHSFHHLSKILGCQAIVAKVRHLNVGTFYHINDTQLAVGGTHIYDGGFDMYDTGNCISVPATSSAFADCSAVTNKVAYLKNCDMRTVNGQSYAMSMRNDGISVLYFPSYIYNEISINGDIGADGAGSIVNGTYTYNGWNGFWKVTWAADPGINHLWVTNAPNAYHDFDGTKRRDYDRLSGVNGYQVIYLMWGTVVGTRSSDFAMQQLIRAVSHSGELILSSEVV